MKKIFFVANVQFTITHFRKELIAQLREMGHEVFLVCPNATGNLYVEPDKHVIDLKISRGGINPFKDFMTLKELVVLFHKEKPDIIINFTVKPIIYSSIAAGFFLKGSRVFSNITGLGYVFTDSSAKAWIIRFIVKSLYRLALLFNQKVFFQNPDDESFFVQSGIVRKDQVVALNGSGINLQKISISFIEKEKQSFIFVGRLLKDKGLNELVEAVLKLYLLYPQVKCYIVGGRDDNPNSFTEDQIKLFSRCPALIFLGHRKDALTLLQKCEVYVLPSYREGTPRSTLEAMATGLPIITTDAPGCRETVIDQENGFLVPVMNSEVLYEKMKFFLDHPESIPVMGKKSREYVEKKFNVIDVNQKILDVLGV